MGLERIEVENFKSYLGVHVIGPFDRLTCIVGPNGSGKSNIMDAITFCLGIGAGQLRARSARGLINGKCRYASVALCVSFLGARRMLKRWVNHEGRSSYFVDGQSVGHEGFLAVVSGMNLLVGVRNFLVFQGDVNGIGSMMPMELGRLFEEMSGSIEVKEEYEEKQRAQEKAVRECARLFEERRELMARMKEASEVREQEDVLKGLVERREVVQRGVVLHELREKDAATREMGKEVERLEGESRQMQGLVEDKEKEVEEHRGRINKVRQEYFEADAEVSRRKEMVRERRERRWSAEEDRNKRRVRGVEIEMEIRNKEEMMRGRQKEIARRRGELEAMDGGYSLLLKEEEERKARVSGMEQSKELVEKKEEELFRLCGEDLASLRELDLGMFSKKMLRNDYMERMKELGGRIEELRGMIAEKKTIRMNIGVKIDALSRSEEDLRRRMSSSEQRYERLVCEEKERNSELSNVVGEILRIKGRRRIDTRRATVQGAVDTLKGMFPGVYGRVVDLIRATQERYEVALSVLLGAHDQSVVVDTEATAMACINFIRDKKLCKMTFLPLQGIRCGEERAEEALRREMEGYGGRVRRASDAITYDGKYRKVVLFLFGEKLIADTLEIARDICYGKGLRKNVCTLDGVYIHGGGNLISGGGGGRNKFEEDELDKLMARRARIVEDLRRIQDCKNELSHVEIWRERAEVWRKSREAEMAMQEELEVSIGMLETKLAESDKELGETSEALRCVEEEIGRSEDKGRRLQERIEKAEAEMFCGIFPNEHFGSYEEYREARDCDSFGSRAAEYESARAKVELRIESLSREVADLERDIEALRSEAKGLDRELLRSVEDLSALENELVVFEETRKAKLDMFEKMREGFRRLNDEFRGLVGRKNEIDRGIVCCTSARERLMEEVRSCLSFAALEEIELPCRGGGLSRSIGSVEEIDFSGMTGSGAELRRELEEINQKIDSQVPLIRVEERGEDRGKYTRVNEEYERLKAAAIAAKNELNDAKRRRTHLFMECFERVNKEVARIYKSLTMTETSEGNAYLALGNTAEPFKEGIRFHLMPPNKRFREARMLSGGERTMAVLSLLFAFHAYRPAPFYVFDEIDSALDKTNVARVVSFMMSCDAQFVLITLKPALFQHANGLVGVYKDPHEGTSRVLTYRLDD